MKLNLSPYADRSLCVALSGGQDSMALLHYLLQNANKYNIRISAAHLEHGIRGESSLRDAAFVRDYCAAAGVPLFERSEDCVAYSKEHKTGLEEGAREVRYRFFADLIKSKKAEFVCTAHHADDNAETVLFNLFRGCALRGVSGMAALRDRIVRLMLGVTQEEINAYVCENNIPYVQDESNADTRYTRNDIRANILPAAKRMFPACCKHIYNFSRLAREDDDYLCAEAYKACTVLYDVFTFPANLPRPLYLRACVLAFHVFGIEKDYTGANFQDVYALSYAENGAKIDLPFGIVAAREYGKIAIYRPHEDVKEEYPFGAGEFLFGRKRLQIIEGDFRTEEKSLRLDADKLPAGCVIRARREGDVFEKFGGGTKKLKEFLIDKKIPARLRGEIPLIACGKEVYAVCGTEISNKVKTDCDSKRVVTIILREGEK